MSLWVPFIFLAGVFAGFLLFGVLRRPMAQEVYRQGFIDGAMADATSLKADTSRANVTPISSRRSS